MARTYFAPDATVPSFSVQGEDGVEQQALVEAIRPLVPAEAEVVTGTQAAQEQSAELESALGFINTFLLVFAGIALFVGSFIIVNTFAMLVAQRGREVALLRALGASQRQVVWSLLLEAAVVGLVASLLGIGAGIGLAAGLKAVLATFGFDLGEGLPVQPRTVVVNLLVGVLVTVFAAWLPIRRTRRIPPVAALRDDATLAERSLRRRVLCGAVVFVAGVATLIVGLIADGSISAILVGVGAAVTFLGAALLFPLASRPVVEGLGLLFRPYGTMGRLARLNAARNPRRTAGTASALMIGVALVGAVGVLAASAKAAVADTVDSALRADFVIDSGGFVQFPPTIAERARDLDGVASVATLGAAPVRIGGVGTEATAASPTDLPQAVAVTVTAGSIDALAAKSVLVSATLAEEQGWQPGDSVDLTLGSLVDQPVQIGGIYEPNQLLGAVVVPREVSDRALPPTARGDYYAFVNVRASRTGGRTAVTGRPGAAVRRRVGADPGAVQGRAGGHCGPVARAHLRPAGHGDRDRGHRHRQHVAALGLRADP